MSKKSFSTRLREELLEHVRLRREYWDLAFQSMAHAAMRFQSRELRFSTRQREFASLLQEQIELLYGVKADCRQGKEQSSIRLSDPETYRRIKEDIEIFQEKVQTELLSAPSVAYPNVLSQEERYEILAIILAELFLSCGALSSPRDAYQLEFSFPRKQSALFFKKVLEHLGMDMRLIHHRANNVLYAKDGQSIADFLLYSGAHSSLLAFEELRVEKEVLNQVNRVVNCDSANAQRVADSSALQREAILSLQDSDRWSALSAELQEAGRARLQFPELSLAELGQKMKPPIGKSGMNHRLKKLISAANALKKERRGK